MYQVGKYISCSSYNNTTYQLFISSIQHKSHNETTKKAAWHRYYYCKNDRTILEQLFKLRKYSEDVDSVWWYIELTTYSTKYGTLKYYLIISGDFQHL